MKRVRPNQTPECLVHFHHFNIGLVYSRAITADRFGGPGKAIAPTRASVCLCAENKF